MSIGNLHPDVVERLEIIRVFLIVDKWIISLRYWYFLVFYLHDLLFFPMFKALQCLHRFSRFFNHIHSCHNWQNWHGIACYQVGSVGNAACTNITWVLWESIYSAFKAGTSHSSLPVMALLVVEWGGWGLGAPKYCLQQSVISFWSTVSGQPPSKSWKGWRSSGFSLFLSNWLDYLALVLVVHVL